MARRVPKLLVPLMIVVAAIAMAMWAMLPSSASEMTPHIQPTATFDPGPKDCADCANPGT